MEVQHQPFALPNSLFHNNGGLSFEDLSLQTGADFVVPAAHCGAAFGDLNNDGKIDVCRDSAERSSPDSYEPVPHKNHWIILKLTGTKSCTDFHDLW